jgi:hypothetical protein
VISSFIAKPPQNSQFKILNSLLSKIGQTFPFGD